MDLSLTSLMRRNIQATTPSSPTGSLTTSSPIHYHHPGAEVGEGEEEGEVTMSSDEKDGGKKQHEEAWKLEKGVFETQLNQLQEQLVSAMVQNQELGKLCRLKGFTHKLG